jgi:HD-like signal output (HDOD) protein
MAADPVAAFADRLRARFRSAAYAPPALPEVALAFQRSARSPGVSLASLAALLETDAILTARVLRLTRARAIREAIERMGLKLITELVWQAALDIGVFRGTQHRRTLEQLRRHSSVTAYLARTAAQFSPAPVEDAFLAGLVHDVGLAAALFLLGGPAEGGRAGAAAPAANRELRGVAVGDREIRAVAQVHEELSGRVAERWGLPDDVGAAIAHHHRPGERSEAHPLSAVVLIAEHLGRSLGAPQPLAAAGWDPVDRQRLKIAYRTLELSPAQMKIVEAEARIVLADLEAT